MSSGYTVMPKMLCTALAAALAASAVPAAAIAVSEKDGSENSIESGAAAWTADEEIFVELQDNADEARAASQLEKIKGVGQVETHEGYVTATLERGFDAEAVADKAEETIDGALSAGEDVVLDSTGTVTSVNDTYVEKQYYLQEWDSFYTLDESGIGAERAWKALAAAQLEDVSVAVIDTGVDVSHPDLSGRLDLEHAYNVEDNSKDVADKDGHGTAAAGVIAAEANNNKGIAGVAGSAPVKILPIKCCDATGEIRLSGVLASFRYLCGLVESGQAPELRVVNCSFGGYASSSASLKPGSSLDTYIETLRKAGVVTVAAGGNGIKQQDGTTKASTAAHYPSDYTNTVGVTALQKNGCDAKWSDYNKSKDISAPGEDIATTWTGGQYSIVDGTSFSAPMVSSTFAMMFAANPGLTPSSATKIVKDMAGYVRPSSWKRTEKQTGSAGALNTSLAVYSALESKTSALVDDVGKTYTAAKKGAYKGKLAKTKSFTLRVAKGMDVKSWTAKAVYTSFNGKKAKTSKIAVGKAGKVTAKRGLKRGTWKVTVKTTARTHDGRSVDSFAYVTIKVK